MNNSCDNVLSYKSKRRNGGAGGHKRLCGAKILIAEDFESNRDLLKAILGYFAMEVDVVENGSQTLDIVERKRIEQPDCPYDAILMDIHMPVLDGMEAARRIRSKRCYEGLPIIGMSAAVVDYGLKECLACGMNDFVGKPIDIDELLIVLDRWIDRK